MIPIGDINELEASVHMHDVLNDDGSIYYSVPLTRIHGIADSAVGEKINNTLEEIITNLADNENYWLSLATVTISHVGNRYLQLSYQVVWVEPRSNVILINIILDTQTGERLFLDDIVELTDSFSETIRAQHDPDNEIYIFEENIPQMLKEASMSEKEYKAELAKEDTCYESATSMSYVLSKKAVVYVNGNGVEITRHITSGEVLYFPYDQLPELKIQLEDEDSCSFSLDLTVENRQKICQEH